MQSSGRLAALASLFALVACGGGGTTGGAPPPPPPATSSDAVLSLSIAGGASPGIDHLWVTITGVALNQDATRVFGDGSDTWITVPLSAAMTIDLASVDLSQGKAVQLLKQNISTLGTYGQLRLLVAPSDPASALTASAKAQGLVFNDQVEYTDAAGTAHVVPLEVPDLAAGLRLTTSFTLSADTTTPLAIEWNAQSSLVHRQAANGGDRYALRNELQLYNQQLLTALGDGIDGSLFDAIAGQLDTTQFCTATTRTGCIHDVVASATSLSSDGRFHRDVRSVNVSASGTFALYPLPSDSVYDVVIRGANMQTIVVRNVFVDPTGLLRFAPTELSSAATPIVPVLDTSGHAFVPTTPPLPDPPGSRLYFGQTIPGSGGAAGDVPYTIATASTDPFTGLVVDTITLPGGPIQTAVFDPKTDGNGTPPAFTTVTPAEGANAFTAWTRGTLANATSAFAALPAGATTLAMPDPPQLAGFAAGTLTVNVSGTSTNGADRAELIVSNDGGIVSDTDVSSLVAKGGAAKVTVLSGQSSSAPAAAVYGVSLRTWKSGTDVTTSRWIRIGTPVDLSTTATASVSLTLP
jgi:hypothetical protein